MIEPSAHDRATAYLAAHRYRLQDRAPYLYETHDYGASWQRITDGIPDGDFTRVIRSDPVRPGLLYAGTETAAYVSLDDGKRWCRLAANLPTVPIYDLVVKGCDLVAASHGRGFWILDDVTPLRELPDDADAEPLDLFTPPVTYRYPTPPGTLRPASGKSYLGGPAMEMKTLADGTQKRVYLDAGENPRDGVTIWYRLREDAPRDALELSFLDPEGNEVRSFSPEPAPPESPPDGEGAAEGSTGRLEVKQREWEVLPHQVGLQRFTWDLRCCGHRTLPDEKREITTRTGYVVPPGTYTVRLRLADSKIERRFEIRRDPRVGVSDADLAAQYELLIAIRDTRNAVIDGILRTRKISAQVEPWGRRSDVDASLRESARSICKRLREVEKVLTNPKLQHAADRLVLPVGLDGKLEDLPAAVTGFDARPTRQAREVYEKHRALADQTLARLEEIARADVVALEEKLAEARVPIVDTSVPEAKTRGQ